MTMNKKLGVMLKKFSERYSDDQVRGNRELQVLKYYLEFMGDIHGKAIRLATNNPKQDLINKYLF